MNRIVVFVDRRIVCTNVAGIDKFLDESKVEQNAIYKYLATLTKEDNITDEKISAFITAIIHNINPNAKIEIELGLDYDDIKTSYQKISQKTDRIYNEEIIEKNQSNKISSSSLIFNITPGTKNFTVALAMASLKADRCCFYKEQNGERRGLCINLQTYDFKDSLNL